MSADARPQRSQEGHYTRYELFYASVLAVE